MCTVGVYQSRLLISASRPTWAPTLLDTQLDLLNIPIISSPLSVLQFHTYSTTWISHAAIRVNKSSRTQNQAHAGTMMPNALFDPLDPTSPLSASPRETALLLMDYQNLLRTRIGDGAWFSVTKIASQLRDWALDKNIAVYHCLVDLTGSGTRPPQNMRISSKWKHYESILDAAPHLGSEADGLVSGAPSWLESTVVRTPGFVSALESHGLLDILKARQVKSLIIGGISTSGCVLSTARAATDRGFIVTVAEDACYDPVPALHGMLVAHVLPATAHVATSKEIRDAWMVL
jgi:nicotinamidase-related amidase